MVGVAAAMALISGVASGEDLRDDPPGNAGLTPTELGWDPIRREFVLPPLPYPPEALEPVLDAQTVRLHHDVHHAGYVKGLNAALAALASYSWSEGQSAGHQSTLRDLSFHASGHFLHVVYWRSLLPGSTPASAPSDRLGAAIDRDFGNINRFRAQFVEAASSVEGSGWAILAHEPLADRLVVLQAEKHQDHTVSGTVPLIAIDVWEHAYYLRYQNNRRKYAEMFADRIDWSWASRLMP